MTTENSSPPPLQTSLSSEAPCCTPSEHAALASPSYNFQVSVACGKRAPFGCASPPNPKRNRVYAPPSPQPWWRQPPRAAALYKRPDCCANCRSPSLDAECERCEKRLCELCTRMCDVCGVTACAVCSVVDYDCPFDRTLCFSCSEDATIASQQNNESNDINPVAEDGDEVMISLE